jgi:hypothetical protein
MESTTDRIREYARSRIVEPARRQHLSIIKIVAGDLHKTLGLNNRVPLVCSALGSRKFQQENNLELISREGPPSGQSSRVTFTYRLNDQPGEATGAGLEDHFLRLRGIAKEVFQRLGGGETFIRKEREQFYGPERED